MEYYINVVYSYVSTDNSIYIYSLIMSFRFDTFSLKYI